MPATALTPMLKVTVLKHLINDRNIDFITAATDLTRDQVLQVQRDHGYPDNDKMAWAVDILAKKTDELPPAATATIRPARPATPTVATVTTTTNTGHAAPMVEQLVVRAKASNKAATRKLGERVQALVEQLRSTVKAEERTARAAAEQAAADTARLAEIAKLEAKLAELRGTTTTKTSSGGAGDSKKIRAWAADNDVACPAVGRVPAAVREAYTTAHAKDAA